MSGVRGRETEDLIIFGCGEGQMIDITLCGAVSFKFCLPMGPSEPGMVGL